MNVSLSTWTNFTLFAGSWAKLRDASSMSAEVKTGQSLQLSAMAQNMYRVGDFVYIEQYPSTPYAIRRIDELNKV